MPPSQWLAGPKSGKAEGRKIEKEKGGENMQYYRKNNTFIIQNGWEWANDYTFTADDYEVGSVICQSTEEWLSQGYEQVDVEELINELKTRGYDAEEILRS